MMCDSWSDCRFEVGAQRLAWSAYSRLSVYQQPLDEEGKSQKRGPMWLRFGGCIIYNETIR